MEDKGHYKVELWSAALNMVTLSRTILSPRLRRHVFGFNQATMMSFNVIPGVNDLADKLNKLGILSPKAKQVTIQSLAKKAALPAKWLTLLRQQKYDEPKNLGRLPHIVWQQIIKQVADPRSVLTAEQVKQTMAFGSDRGTLAEEREAQAKGETHQIWRLLESTGCLSYKIIV
jgi:hypothetical protein